MKLNKKVFFITGGLLVLLLLGVLAYSLIVKKNIGLSNNPNNLSPIEFEKEQQKINYESYQTKMAIVYASNIESCEKLDSPKRINECINDIAVQSSKKDYCEKITDEKLKGDCVNAIDYMVVSWGNDPNLCDSLSGEVHKNNCFLEYFVKLSEAAECDKVRNEIRKTQCRDLVNKRLATVFNKPEACDLIMDAKIKESCQKAKIIIPLDSDKDGLPDDVELSFGTDPFKVDTDSDGTNDFDEINKLHTNPLSSDIDGAAGR